ncbi:DUF58 domain-containing protein [Planctobacterium marinum]|uniref:DUF58 domain-containing protein n=1 Tax=Planctobacterium marinum TaxID=1631968 RepID=UPI001E3AAD21|nr:DUF58 domain-containing protein [Planctobacterium marinum]MCC2605669.1 DUF58 domain-containing protein [Planctobacterium marinum]
MALPEELLALLQYDDLEFISRTIAEGYLSGHHPSVRKGVGTDFNQYKVYQQGDEAAKIDWKLFARSDKYFVREAERESERSIHFILDSSASMNFISQSQGALSKFNYGKYLIGALAYLAQKQGDPFSLTLINNNGLDITATGSGRAHWYRVLNALQQHNSTGAFPGTHWQSHLSGLVSKACMVVFISDCYQSGTEISDCLSLLKHQKNDVLLLHLHSLEELQFDYRGFIKFEDLETGEIRKVNASSVKTRFLAEQQAWLQQLASHCDQRAINLQRLSVDNDFSEAITQFLQQRTRQGR